MQCTTSGSRSFIKRANSFNKLKSLTRWGLAEPVNEEWKYDNNYVLTWQGEKWTTAMQAFTWWVREVVITETRYVRAYKEWIANSHHIMPNFFNQNQWDTLINCIKSKARWSALDVKALSQSLLNDLGEIQT